MRTFTPPLFTCCSQITHAPGRSPKYAAHLTHPIRNTHTQYAIRSAPHTHLTHPIRNTHTQYAIHSTPQVMLSFQIPIRNTHTQYAIRSPHLDSQHDGDCTIRSTQCAMAATAGFQHRIHNTQYTRPLTAWCTLTNQYAKRVLNTHSLNTQRKP